MDRTESIPKLVKDFEEFVTGICVLRRIVDQLFGNASVCEFVLMTAPEFMKVMNRLIINSLISELCSITEPSRTLGNENLTVEQIVNYIGWTERHSDDAKRIAKRCSCYHKQLKAGRNKVLAHKDLITIVNNHEFPLPENIHNEVIEQLHGLLQLAYDNYRVPWPGPVHLGVRGDVCDFVMSLFRSTLYEHIRNDSRLPEDLKDDLRTREIEFGRRNFQS